MLSVLQNTICSCNSPSAINVARIHYQSLNCFPPFSNAPLSAWNICFKLICTLLWPCSKTILPNLGFPPLVSPWFSSSLRKRKNKITLTSTETLKNISSHQEQANALICCHLLIHVNLSLLPDACHFVLNQNLSFFFSWNQNYSISPIFHIILPLALHSKCLYVWVCRLSPTLGSEPFMSVQMHLCNLEFFPEF